jgi:hypothetical protein
MSFLPSPVYTTPGTAIWDTANSNDALNGSSLTVSGNGVIGGSFVVLSNSIVGGNITSSNNVNVNSNLTVYSTITCGLNLNASNAITAGAVNTLNTVLNTTAVAGSNTVITAGTASVLNATSNSFNFSTGATYMVSVPFGASLTSPTFVGAATTGDVKFFGCSATAFPIVASGNTPGYSYRCDSNNLSIFGNIQFVATAQASATEPIRIAGVPVGGLSNVTANVGIMTGGGALSAASVTRIA